MAVDPCTEYGLALAAEDFVPVVLAGVGAVGLAAAAGRVLPQVRVPALVGGALVTAGGLSKAVWKLLVAAEPCRNVELLEQLLFPLLASGFAVIAWALVSVLRGRVVRVWPYAVVLALAAAGAVAAGAMGPLLGAAAVFAVTVGVVAALLARRSGDRLGVALLVVYVVGTLVLPPLAAQPVQSEALQWAEQLTNTVVQGCFAVSAWRLRDRIVRPQPQAAPRTEVPA